MKNKVILIISILLLGIIINMVYFFCKKENIKEFEKQIIRLENSNNLLKYSLFQSIIYGKDTINSIIKTSDEIVSQNL
jgi:hypothetical protein